MKKAILVLATLGLSMAAMAQHPFTCTTEGAKFHYMTTDAKGNESSTSDMEITKVVSDGSSFTITQVIQVLINGTAFTKPIETTSTVKDGDVVVDFSGGLSLATEGGGFILPKRLAVGLELPTGEVSVEMQGLKIKQDITFHKVVAKEEITVPGGTYECYVVERQYTAKMLGMKVKGSMKTWYARGIGTVKMETYDKKGKLSSSQILMSVDMP